MDSAPSPESTSSWFVKAKRAATDQDDETWREGGVCPTLNDFDNGHDTRATVLATVTARYGKGADSDGQGVNDHALTAEGHDASEDGTGRGTPIIAFHQTQDPISGDVAPSLGATSLGMGVAATTVRRLTPRECERLMGWPDDHTRYRIAPDGTVVEQADSNRYRQCGNGMAAPVVAWIARRIVGVDS